MKIIDSIFVGANKFLCLVHTFDSIPESVKVNTFRIPILILTSSDRIIEAPSAFQYARIEESGECLRCESEMYGLQF